MVAASYSSFGMLVWIYVLATIRFQTETRFIKIITARVL